MRSLKINLSNRGISIDCICVCVCVCVCFNKKGLCLVFTSITRTAWPRRVPIAVEINSHIGRVSEGPMKGKGTARKGPPLIDVGFWSKRTRSLCQVLAVRRERDGFGWETRGELGESPNRWSAFRGSWCHNCERDFRDVLGWGDGRRVFEGVNSFLWRPHFVFINREKTNYNTSPRSNFCLRTSVVRFNHVCYQNTPFWKRFKVLALSCWTLHFVLVNHEKMNCITSLPSEVSCLGTNRARLNEVRYQNTSVFCKRLVISQSKSPWRRRREVILNKNKRNKRGRDNAWRKATRTWKAKRTRENLNSSRSHPSRVQLSQFPIPIGAVSNLVQISRFH